MDVFGLHLRELDESGSLFYIGVDAVCKVIDHIGHYKILKAQSGYVVTNIKASYKHHGHFKKLKTCYIIIKLIQRGQVPRSDYLRGSALRISIDDNYLEKIRHKIEKDKKRIRYININKGV